MSKTFKLALALMVFVILFIILVNYIMLQRHMNNVLNEDERNEGVKVWVHYKWLVKPNEIVYDLRTVSGQNSANDINRVLIQFSSRVKKQKFDRVLLSFKGKEKFYFKGDYFSNLGEEYGVQNPIYTIRTMPENVYTLNGQHKYGVWDGGWLGVMGKQMEDLNTFAKDWYLNEIILSNK